MKLAEEERASPSDSAAPMEETPFFGLRARSMSAEYDYGSFAPYMAACHNQRIRPSADALIRAELGCSRLVVQGDGNHAFGNLELKTLILMLTENGGTQLSKFTVLDVSECKLGPSAALLIAKLLKHPRCVLEEVNLSYQPIGPEGGRAIAEAIPHCTTMNVLTLHTCDLQASGAQAVIDLISNGRFAHNLKKIDLQNNFIGYHRSRELEVLCLEQGIDIDLNGNRVVDEILNAITHGIGFVLCLIGSVCIGVEIHDKPNYYSLGVFPYCVSINVLFLSSCLYHSFHALGRTVNRIFCILDHAGIYGMIAGSYTPFLVILMHDVWWSPYFLALIWTVAALGTFFTILYDGPMKMHIENAFYLIMGWGCVSWIHEAYVRLAPGGFALLVAGGVLYSLGVPWFVKDGHTAGIPDHVVWHMFVLAACTCHFYCIFEYVLRRPVMS